MIDSNENEEKYIEIITTNTHNLKSNAYEKFKLQKRFSRSTR